MNQPNQGNRNMPITAAVYGRQQRSSKTAKQERERKPERGTAIASLIPAEIANALGFNPLTGRMRGQGPKRRRPARKGAK